MKKFIEGYKKFLIRGNLMDLAVGIMVGTAFTGIVKSFVANILTPIVGLFLGKAKVSDWAYSVQYGDSKEQILNIPYGAFLQASIDFLILAFVIYLIVEAMNRLKQKAEDPKDTSVPTPKDIELLSEIRDLLKENSKLN